MNIYSHAQTIIHHYYHCLVLRAIIAAHCKCMRTKKYQNMQWFFTHPYIQLAHKEIMHLNVNNKKTCNKTSDCHYTYNKTCCPDMSEMSYTEIEKYLQNKHPPKLIKTNTAHQPCCNPKTYTLSLHNIVVIEELYKKYTIKGHVFLQGLHNMLHKITINDKKICAKIIVQYNSLHIKDLLNLHHYYFFVQKLVNAMFIMVATYEKNIMITPEAHVFNDAHHSTEEIQIILYYVHYLNFLITYIPHTKQIINDVCFVNKWDVFMRDDEIHNISHISYVMPELIKLYLNNKKYKQTNKNITCNIICIKNILYEKKTKEILNKIPNNDTLHVPIQSDYVYFMLQHDIYLSLDEQILYLCTHGNLNSTWNNQYMISYKYFKHNPYLFMQKYCT